MADKAQPELLPRRAAETAIKPTSAGTTCALHDGGEPSVELSGDVANRTDSSGDVLFTS